MTDPLAIAVAARPGDQFRLRELCCVRRVHIQPKPMATARCGRRRTSISNDVPRRAGDLPTKTRKVKNIIEVSRCAKEEKKVPENAIPVMKTRVAKPVRDRMRACCKTSWVSPRRKSNDVVLSASAVSSPKFASTTAGSVNGIRADEIHQSRSAETTPYRKDSTTLTKWF